MSDPGSDGEEDTRKRNIAVEMTSSENIVISIQIVNEVYAVLRRKPASRKSKLNSLSVSSMQDAMLLESTERHLSWLLICEGNTDFPTGIV